MQNNEIERRAFLADPALKLVDIPEQAALLADNVTVSHDELALAIKSAQEDYRAKAPSSRRRSAP